MSPRTPTKLPSRLDFSSAVSVQTSFENSVLVLSWQDSAGRHSSLRFPEAVAFSWDSVQPPPDKVGIFATPPEDDTPGSSTFEVRLEHFGQLTVTASSPQPSTRVVTPQDEGLLFDAACHVAQVTARRTEAGRLEVLLWVDTGSGRLRLDFSGTADPCDLSSLLEAERLSVVREARGTEFGAVELVSTMPGGGDESFMFDDFRVFCTDGFVPADP